MRKRLGESWRFLSRYLGPMWLSALLLTVLILTNTALLLVNPQIIRTFIDSVQTSTPLSNLIQAGVLFIVLALIQQVVSVAAIYLSENIGWSTTNRLRAELVDHCLRLDLSFHNQHTPGEMIERIDGDVTTLSNLFSQFIIQVVSNLLLLVGILVLMFVEDWRVGLSMALFTAINFIVITRLRNIAVPLWKAERQASADLYGYIEERLSGMEDIRANDGRPYILRNFYRLSRELRARSIKAAVMINALINSSMVLFSISVAIAMALSAYLFLAGIVTMGGAYMVFFYTNLLRLPIDRILNQLQDLQRATASITRIQELFAVQARVRQAGVAGQPRPADSPAAAPGAPTVVFDQVSFAYHDDPSTQEPAPPERGAKPETVPALPDSQGKEAGALPAESVDMVIKEMVLKDVSFRLEGGQVLGLLGRTGSGKTTLARLLFRFYDPDSGSILLGNGGTGSTSGPVDLRDIPFEDLWQQIGMVTQNIQLFHASVRDNLTFFDPSVPEERILAVIDELGLGAWLRSLPNGLDTELESGGASLSAGEAQLLAFTRIFLKNPGLVILDEATSRLDPATEVLIERAVERLVQGRTAIIIAHRLGTVQRADQILVLDDGHLLEYGPRQALAADPNSRFHHLLQTGLEEVLA